MALKVKVGWFGIFDMLKFKLMGKTREKTIQKAKPVEITGEYKINQNAKALHPDSITVIIKEIISHDNAGAKTFILSKEDGSALPYFNAGAYISVKIKIGESYTTRAYSISSSPKWALEGKYAITVKENKEGFVAPYMMENLKVGDKLVISSPQGDFCYSKYRDEKHVIAAAGGSGITPFLSMAYAVRDGIEDFELTIIYGSKTKDVILFKDELDKIASECERVKVVYVLAHEEVEGFEHGYITADLIKKYANDKYSLYICGPSSMYDFLRGETEKLGIARRLIRWEAQSLPKDITSESSDVEAVKDKVFKIKVVQGPNEYEIEAKATETLLTSFERAGIKAPSRCRSGSCGWCRSHVVSGEFYAAKAHDGRRWADRENNDIHPCASYPLSDMVIEVPGEYWPEV